MFMSRLTEALEYLYNFLCLEYPEIASSLQPGLTREEIDEKVKHLRFSLPEEVYELYQWRNGMRGTIFFELLYDGYRLDIEINDTVTIALFYSLEKAINSYFMKYTPFLMPLFSWYDNMVAGGFFAVNLEQGGSPIVHYIDRYLNELEQEKDFYKNNIIYSSLTDLILAIAECCEAALLPSSSKGVLLIDEDKFEQIYLKYKV